MKSLAVPLRLLFCVLSLSAMVAACSPGIVPNTCATGTHACSAVCYLDSDPTRCGSSCTACPSTNGTATCSSGTCGIICNRGYNNENGRCIAGADAGMADAGGVTCDAGFNKENGQCVACRWKNVDIGVYSGYLTSIRGSGVNDVWAVGHSGRILHWDGLSWASVDSGTSVELNGVWAISNEDAWAVGERGEILHWDGGSWTSVDSGTTEVLNSVAGARANDVWAVGGSGTILRWNGSSWTEVDGVRADYDGLRGLWSGSTGSVGSVWAVGFRGTIRRWNGSSLPTVDSGTNRQLEGVWGTSEVNIWAVGGSGTILRWNSISWASVDSGVGLGLTGVWAATSEDAWAVGPGTVILRWDGTSWKTISISELQVGSLLSVWGSSANDVWACGVGASADGGVRSSNVILRWQCTP